MSALSRMFHPVDAYSSWAETEAAVHNGDAKDVVKSCSVRMGVLPSPERILTMDLVHHSGNCVILREDKGFI